MDASQSFRAAESYTTRLDKTLERLQEQVKEQEDLLVELQASTAAIDTEPSVDLQAHLQQLRALKGAYEVGAAQEPYLPSVNSPIPALLALKVTDKCIRETQICIASTDIDLQKLQARLGEEQAELKITEQLQKELESRISQLEHDLEARTRKTPAQISKELVQNVKLRTKHYDTETGKLVKAFNQFIDEHLSPMLAAEELGGPVVGGILDVDEDMLEMGFSNQGRPKKSKVSKNEDKRQRRINEIWGPRAVDDGADEPYNEQQAAASEMRELTEQLLNSLVEDGGNGTGTYVELNRESAASRFLVRAKVAQFHAKDAKKLRLIDFGAEIDD